MGKKNCPICGRYVKSGPRGIPAHQRDSAFCKSMKEAARKAREDDDMSDAQWYFLGGGKKLIEKHQRENP